jgi:hypothetical protein
MGQLMLSTSTNILSIGAARVKKAADRNRSDNLPGSVRPALPLTPERLELIKSLARQMSRSTAERMAQPPPRQTIPNDRIPRSQTQSSQILLVLPRQLWVLLTLIFIALLPNLTLIPIFWLRFLDRPASTPTAIPAHQNPIIDQSSNATVLSDKISSVVHPSSVPTPVLSAPPIVEATLGEHVSFPIAVDGTDGMPPLSRIVIKGLPSGSELSNGYRISNGEWNLNSDQIGDLHLVLGDNATSDTKLAIQLVAPDGRIVADTATTLKMTDPQASVVTSGIAAQQTETQLSTGQTQSLEVIEATEPISPGTNLSTSDSAPIPTRNPKAENKEDNAKWVKSSASVNLRKGPSSSAAIISVVERATKLRAIGRKKGWVQVTNPSTSETGWIYAENVETMR